MMLALMSPASAGKKKANSEPPRPTLEVAAAELAGRALSSTAQMDDLVELCDDIGARLSGSVELERAIAWSADKMRSYGLANVRTEAVEVPHWERGKEEATLLLEPHRPLNIMTLGGSVPTPAEGIEAPIIVVRSFDELEQRRSEVPGAIVVYNASFVTYGETVQYRTRGPSEAARLGAVAALVRSVGPASLDTPHTGVTRYEEGVSAIPAAAITIETAEQLQRLQDRGQAPSIRLVLGASDKGTAESANVIGEVTGSEHPDEIVVLACHLDSWDVGQGAQDDGAGCMMALHAARLISEYDTPPRRTIRVVLYTNEENGMAGARAYAEAHAEETHIAAIESDSGAGAPSGVRFDLRRDHDADATMNALSAYGSPLAAIHAEGIRAGYSGADIGPLAENGVPTFGIDHDTTEYFKIHHTDADTIDKIDPAQFQYGLATMTVWAWTLAESGVPVVNSP